MHVYINAVLRDLHTNFAMNTMKACYVSAALRECGACVRQCSVEGVWYMCTSVQR